MDGDLNALCGCAPILSAELAPDKSSFAICSFNERCNHCFDLMHENLIHENLERDQLMLKLLQMQRLFYARCSVLKRLSMRV